MYYIQRVRYFDGEAYILDHNWFLKSVMPELTKKIAEKSIYEYMEKTLGITIATTARKKTEEPMIRTRLLDFDYTTREWFRTPVEKEKNLWTQPYVDQGGTKIIMCTFVEPIRDRTGHVVGVLFADVPMEDVSILSMDMDGLIERGGRISVMVMLVFLGLFCVILWLSIRASQRYRKDTYDSEIQKLKSEIEHLKTINRKLMQRNLDLSKKESASHFLG